MAVRHPYWSLTTLAVLVALPYALFGVGFVLDDWLALGNARFDGALAAAGLGEIEHHHMGDWVMIEGVRKDEGRSTKYE